jgi:hypothetical protein
VVERSEDPPQNAGNWRVFAAFDHIRPAIFPTFPDYL